jgi:hypothetical protein
MAFEFYDNRPEEESVIESLNMPDRLVIDWHSRIWIAGIIRGPRISLEILRWYVPICASVLSQPSPRSRLWLRFPILCRGFITQGSYTMTKHDIMATRLLANGFMLLPTKRIVDDTLRLNAGSCLFGIQVEDRRIRFLVDVFTPTDLAGTATTMSEPLQ